MPAVAIRAENLGKQYQLGSRRGGYRTLREAVVETALSPWRRLRHLAGSGPQAEWFWALREVGFEIHPGEAVGIVGRNGAGKSTLLKILSRITEPTQGRAELHGRVGSLLEVGTGFHPELTGRENVYLNGAILGMSRGDIRRKFDDIVAFAGVEQFLDTPVKRYSSGMYVRLAFAVAAHLEPEILVVDEVLAVGDIRFQRQCLGKMKDVAGQGRTVLFVSHNMAAISTLTQRCLLLAHGKCIADGPTAQVVAQYARDAAEELIYRDQTPATQPRVTRVELKTSDADNLQRCGDALAIEIEVNTPSAIDGAALSFQAVDDFGRPVLHLSLFDADQPWGRSAGNYRLTCRIPKLHLFMGRYTLTVHFAERFGGKKFQTIEGICPFEVVMPAVVRDYPWREGEATYLEDGDWDVEVVA